MKFAPLIFAVVIFLYIWDWHLMGDQVFPNPDTLPIILNCNVNRQAASLPSSRSPPGSSCTSSLCRTHSICRWTWCCRQRPGMRAAPPGRKQPSSLSTSHSIFSLCCFFSHSFSRHPQLNFLFRCLSSLFAHSQHPPFPSTPPPFLYYPISQEPRSFPFSSSHCLFLKSGIVMLVWLLILSFPNIKQNMGWDHNMGNSKLILT